jgi:CheY-like chemotaxis protein
VARVLLVDDDIAEISSVKRVLSREGHQAVLATSIADAVALAAQERPPAAIVSATCESGGGSGLVRRLLDETPEQPLRVLLLGEAGEPPAGAILIPRPLDPAQLAGELRIALGPSAREAPSARIPVQALSGGSPSATGAAEAGRRAAAAALAQRAEDLRRGGEGVDGRGPSTPPPPAPAAIPGPPSPFGAGGEEAEDPARRRRAEEARLVAEIDAELDRLTREAEEDHPAAAPGPVDEAEEIARRAEEEADRRHAEEALRAEEAFRRAREEARLRAEEESARSAQQAARSAEETRLAEEEAFLLEEVGLDAAEPPPAPPETFAPEASAAAGGEQPRAPAAEPPAPARHLAHPAPERIPGPAAGPEPSETPPELAAGTLREAPMPRILALAGRSSYTGRIDFGTAFPRSVYFELGRVVGATSSAPHERVEELALRLGLLTREQHRQAVPATAGISSRRAALALLEQGFLKPEELTPLARRRTEEVVFALCAEADGPFRSAPARVPPEERTALGRGPLSLAVDGVRRRWMDPRLGALLGGPATLLAPAPRAPPPSELGLSAPEEQAFALADGLRTLDEIVEGSPLDALSTRQLLAALVLVGALVPRFQAAAARATDDRVIDRARLREKLDQVRRADYFTILGLSRQCTPYEVRDAAERLLADFDPLRFHGQRETGLGDEIEEVRRVVTEARHVLTDEPLRAEYESGLGP